MDTSHDIDIDAIARELYPDPADVGRPTLPTLEGRTMADLGQQVEQLRRETIRLRAALESMRDRIDAVLKTP